MFAIMFLAQEARRMRTSGLAKEDSPPFQRLGRPRILQSRMVKVEVEYFQVLQDGRSLHTYSGLHLMAISYLADPPHRALQGIMIKEGSWQVSRVFTEEQARGILADHLRRCARHALSFPDPTRTFLVVEGERELGVTVGLHEAALLWNENPDVRTVFRAAPPDGTGAGTWKRISGVAVGELRGEISR
jgi:hypothetical protein